MANTTKLSYLASETISYGNATVCIATTFCIYDAIHIGIVFAVVSNRMSKKRDIKKGETNQPDY